tara:strand:+ start:458 stop:1048 length:591 start_codon:yes stop_codon:yes gene_type:complete
MKSNKWLERNKKDIFVKNAKLKGYLSRSAFKLIEIDDKFNLIGESINILELGSSPGGWSQVICDRNNISEVYCFDIKKMEYKNKQIKFFKKNFMEFDFKNLKKKYDLILSDSAPNTTGHKSTDHLRIVTLIEKIINIVENYMQKKGNLIFKIWKGSQEKTIYEILKKKFKKVSYFKPKSSRQKSSEIYIIAQEYFF